MRKLSLTARIVLAPFRIVALIIMAIPVILIEAAGENGMEILDLIMDAGNE